MVSIKTFFRGTLVEESSPAKAFESFLTVYLVSSGGFLLDNRLDPALRVEIFDYWVTEMISHKGISHFDIDTGERIIDQFAVVNEDILNVPPSDFIQGELL